MTRKIVNHYGIWVDSDKPITGVLSIHDVCFEWIDDYICVTCEEIISDIESDESLSEEEKEAELEWIECDSDHTRLLGEWIKDENGLYTYDEEGEYAAIENESTIQVIWSKYLVRGPLCSPCYPGQADINANSLESDNGFLAYNLPDYLLRKDED